MTQKIYVDTILYNPSIIVYEWNKKNMEVSFYNKLKEREKKLKKLRQTVTAIYIFMQTVKHSTKGIYM